MSSAPSYVPDMPTDIQFEQYFLFVSYDVISDACQQTTREASTARKDAIPSASSAAGSSAVGSSGQQYKKFVQSNKDQPWARDLIQAVSVVTAVKNSYKSHLPGLLAKNMTQLYRVCTDVVSSNSPPHKEVPHLERCFITGIWQVILYFGQSMIAGARPAHAKSRWDMAGNSVSLAEHDCRRFLTCSLQERMIDVSKSGRHNTTNHITNSSHTTNSGRQSPALSTPASSPSVSSQRSSVRSQSPENLRGLPLGSLQLEDQEIGQMQQQPVTTPERHASERHASERHAVGRAAPQSNTMPPSTSPVYISHRFKHFVQMLWTCARVDAVIRNYALAWINAMIASFAQCPSQHTPQLEESMGQHQCLSRNVAIARFSAECTGFCKALYKLFVHAANHIHVSLHGHLHDSVFARQVSSASSSSTFSSTHPATILSASSVPSRIVQQQQFTVLSASAVPSVVPVSQMNAMRDDNADDDIDMTD